MPAQKYMINQYTPSWQTTLLLLFLFSLAVRMVFILTLKDGFYFGDESIYIDAAEYFVKYGQFQNDFDRAPMYPLFLAGLFWLDGGSLQSVRIVQAVLGAIIALQIAGHRQDAVGGSGARHNVAGSSCGPSIR